MKSQNFLRVIKVAQKQTVRLCSEEQVLYINLNLSDYDLPSYYKFSVNVSGRYLTLIQLDDIGCIIHQKGNYGQLPNIGNVFLGNVFIFANDDSGVPPESKLIGSLFVILESASKAKSQHLIVIDPAGDKATGQFINLLPEQYLQVIVPLKQEGSACLYYQFPNDAKYKLEVAKQEILYRNKLDNTKWVDDPYYTCHLYDEDGISWFKIFNEHNFWFRYTLTTVHAVRDKKLTERKCNLLSFVTRTTLGQIVDSARLDVVLDIPQVKDSLELKTDSNYDHINHILSNPKETESHHLRYYNDFLIIEINNVDSSGWAAQLNHPQNALLVKPYLRLSHLASIIRNGVTIQRFKVALDVHFIDNVSYLGVLVLYRTSKGEQYTRVERKIYFYSSEKRTLADPPFDSVKKYESATYTSSGSTWLRSLYSDVEVIDIDNNSIIEGEAFCTYESINQGWVHCDKKKRREERKTSKSICGTGNESSTSKKASDLETESGGNRSDIFFPDNLQQVYLRPYELRTIKFPFLKGKQWQVKTINDLISVTECYTSNTKKGRVQAFGIIWNKHTHRSGHLGAVQFSCSAGEFRFISFYSDDKFLKTPVQQPSFSIMENRITLVDPLAEDCLVEILPENDLEIVLHEPNGNGWHVDVKMEQGTAAIIDDSIWPLFDGSRVQRILIKFKRIAFRLMGKIIITRRVDRNEVRGVINVKDKIEITSSAKSEQGVIEHCDSHIKLKTWENNQLFILPSSNQFVDIFLDYHAPVPDAKWRVSFYPSQLPKEVSQTLSRDVKWFDNEKEIGLAHISDEPWDHAIYKLPPLQESQENLSEIIDAYKKHIPNLTSIPVGTLYFNLVVPKSHVIQKSLQLGLRDPDFCQKNQWEGQIPKSGPGKYSYIKKGRTVTVLNKSNTTVTVSISQNSWLIIKLLKESGFVNDVLTVHYWRLAEMPAWLVFLGSEHDTDGQVFKFFFDRTERTTVNGHLHFVCGDNYMSTKYQITGVNY